MNVEGHQENGDPIADNGLPYIKEKSESVQSVNAEWHIEFTVVCPHCEEENDLLEIDEWWIVFGSKIGESKQNINYVHTCTKCKTNFNIKDVE